MLFIALSALYYFKERSRLFQEEKVKNRLIYSECKRINDMLKSDQECKMPIVQEIKALQNTHFEIMIAFFIMLLFSIPAAYFLTKTSLRPMRNSIETIDNFINGIVHDINTPISVIKLNAQSMQLQLQNEKHKEKNMRILQGIENIESLEEQLLFSLKCDTYELKESNVDLCKLLQERLPFYIDVRDSVGVVLNTSQINIRVDSAIFIRLIDNLVLNAIKFSHQKSNILINIEDSKLIIQDFGVGIKNPKKIFMKYYRENSNVKGLGLGLFIVKSIADLHKIKISVESKEDEGTKFIIDLKKVEVV